MTPKATETSVVLILGSGPNALDAVNWPRSAFDRIVAINNAWRVRRDWDVLIHPDDFPKDRHPDALAEHQSIITSDAYVPIQNDYGGFVYAGGTMAFTAGYWALGALRPKVLAFIGCDMVYPSSGATHFYGTGAPDPLRKDVSLRSLEAKSARLALLAAAQGCHCVNLGGAASRLVMDRVGLGDLQRLTLLSPTGAAIDHLLDQENRLGYFAPSGRYWETASRYDPVVLDDLDRGWLETWNKRSEALAS